MRLLKKVKSQNSIELDIFLGKDKLPCRLIASKLPKKEKAERIRKLEKSARENKRTLSIQRRLLASWNIFVTNASTKQIPHEQVHDFYRLRWSIELIFKQLKSTLKIHSWNHANVHRLYCEIYAKLIAATLISYTCSLTQAILWKKHQQEVSYEKVFKIFCHNAHELMRILRYKVKEIYPLSRTLIQDSLSHGVKKTQKSRLSTLQKIEN